MSHRRIDCGPHRPLPVVAVGAGLMGRAWLAVLEASDEVDLVGIVDLDTAAARRAAADLGRPDLPVGQDAVALARESGAEAVIDVTVPVAHHPVTTAALAAGLPVLGEKPAADTLARALSLAAAAEVSGELFMVSQSRRWNPQVAALRGLVEDLGAVGTLSTEFFKAPRFGGFRDAMEQPLLVDMAIHAFDTARYVLGSDPVSASCSTWNPSWSWYAGDASATALFAMADGSRYSYTGSWCAPGAETSWNGAWRVSAERGSALWDGEHDPELHADGATPTERPASPYSDIAGALQVFCEALRTGEAPMGEVHENVMSLAMVEAAVESAAAGSPVLLDDVLARAHAQALADEADPAVRGALAGWPSVRGALAGTTAAVCGPGARGRPPRARPASGTDGTAAGPAPPAPDLPLPQRHVVRWTHVPPPRKAPPVPLPIVPPRRVKLGDAAAFAGTTPRAIRHYHQIGLLPEPERGADGRRRYGYQDVIRLLWIRRTAEAGIALDDIRGAFAGAAPAGTGGDHDVAVVLERLEATLVVREAELQRQRAAVQRMRARGSRAGLLSDVVASRLEGLPEGSLRQDDLDHLLVVERTFGPLGAAVNAGRYVAQATHPGLREECDRVDAAEEALDDAVAVDDPRVAQVASERHAVELALQAVIEESGLAQEDDALFDSWEALHPSGGEGGPGSGGGRGAMSTGDAIRAMPYDLSLARLRCMELAVEMGAAEPLAP